MQESGGAQARRLGVARISLAPDHKRLFEAAPGPYLALLPDAPQFTIVAVSDAYAQATKTERDQILGRGIFEVFPDNPDDLQASGTRNLRASLERVADTGKPDAMAVQKYDIPLPQSEGGGFEERYWSPLNSPVLGEDGAIAYIIHRVEDVTDFVRLKQQGAEQAKRAEELQTRAERMETEVYQRAQELQQANEQLRLANDQLGQLDRMKTEFFSNVSHEFRTPLTLLLGPLETLLSANAGPPETLELLRQMQRNAIRLLRLVNTLLDFSRIEAGKHSARFAPTDLARYTSDLASAFRSTFEKAGLSFTVECPPLPEPIHVDRSMWEKIVMNLLSNALKFTFEGGVSVSLASTPGGARLTVADTGTGIPAEELPKVFQRFHRVDGARSRSHEGTGIGLALVHGLVRQHGGEIQVSSDEGKGTQFTVTLQAGRAHLPQEHVVAAPPDATSAPASAAAYLDEALLWLPYDSQPVATARPGGGARVLIADDNGDLLAFLVSLLAPHYEVEAVPDGHEALAAIRRRKPDLVLSDVMMPHLDGIGLVRALREDPETRTLPVILLSARAGQEASLEGLAAGADDYLAKPFTALELLARVRTHLNLAKARDELNAELSHANEELKAFTYTVSHDLRSPLLAINGFSAIVLEHHADQLDAQGRSYLDKVRAAALRMGELIEALMGLSRLTSAQLSRSPVDLSKLATSIAEELTRKEPERQVHLTIPDGIMAEGDDRLLRIVLENLLGNAWKFTSKIREARIAVGIERLDGHETFVVRDNGAGFDMAYADKLFQPFQRVHTEAEFPGTGIGLATVRRIVERHGGRVWAESAPGLGTAIFFTLPAPAITSR